MKIRTKVVPTEKNNPILRFVKRGLSEDLKSLITDETIITRDNSGKYYEKKKEEKKEGGKAKKE